MTEPSAPDRTRAHRWRSRPASWVVLLVLGVAGLAVGWGAAPTEGTSDDRLFRLAEQLRCLQCTGESVANSQAPIAVEMRDEIRRQMARGRTNDEILTFFADRYGPTVLLTPSGSGFVGLIWVLPVVVVGVSLAGLAFVYARARRRNVDLVATPEDEALVAAALDRRHEGAS